MTKFVSILGSTGSVGLAVLKILDKDRLIKINLLCANKKLFFNMFSNKKI